LKNKFGKTGDLAKNGTNAETIVEKLSLDVLQRLKILMTVNDSFFVFFFQGWLVTRSSKNGILEGFHVWQKVL
jgi:hypothetical protein